MLVEFELNGQKFSALNGGPHFTFNEAVSIVVPCADQTEGGLLLEQPLRGRSGECLRLAEGQVRAELADRPGQVLRDDRRPGAEKAARVTRAMFGMTKFDIAALERA